MEAFKCNFLIEFHTGEKKFFHSNVWAPTGWEAAKKVERFIYSRFSGIKNLYFRKWKVLNPYQAHFS